MNPSSIRRFRLRAALAVCPALFFVTGAIGQVLIGGVNQGATATVTTSTNTTSFSIAPNAATTGVLTVTNGSTFQASSGFARVGGAGTGTLNLDSGSTLTVANGVFLSVANSAGSTGTLNASGAGTTVNATGFTGVGQAGTGYFNLSNGATFNGTLQLSFGNTTTGVGYGMISSGATLNTAGGLNLAPVGTGSQGYLTLDGTGTKANVSNWFIVGSTGTGTATIQNGADVVLNANANLTVGNFAGSTGTLNIDGAGSTLTTSRVSNIGNGGTGTVNLTNGGALSTAGAAIGANGNGSVFVGGGASFESTASNNGFLIASQAGGTGSFTVTGAGSSAQITGYMSLGWLGTGTVNVESGAQLSVSGATPSSVFGLDIGRFAGASGTLNIDDAGSLVDLAAGSFVSVGKDGTGALNITNGGALKINGTVPLNDGDYRRVLDVGDATGSSGSVLIDGPGSMATISGNAVIGNRGTGAVFITNGGQMLIDAAGEFLGVGDDGGTGTITIDGAGSRLQVANVIDAGHTGLGRIDVTNGGVIQADGLGLGNYPERSVGTGLLNVTNGGLAQLGLLAIENGTVTVDGGTLAVASTTFVASGGTLAYTGGSFTSNTIFNSGLLSIDARANEALSIHGNLTNNAPGFVDVTPDGPITNATAGRVHVLLGDNATVTFEDAVTNFGLFKITQKPNTSNGNVFFNDTFLNSRNSTFTQDPTTTHFTDLVNDGDFTAGVGDSILVSGGLLNTGAFNLTGSFLNAAGGINNLGTFNIFDSAVFDGAFFGTGNVIFHVLNGQSHLTFGGSFLGNLEIIFDGGYSPFPTQSFVSFFNGASFSSLKIGGVGYDPVAFTGAGSLLVDGSFAPSTAVPEPATYGLFAALALLALAKMRKRQGCRVS